MKRGQGIGELARLEIDHLLDAEDFQERFAAERIHERNGAVGGSKVDAYNVTTEPSFKGGI